MFPLTSHVILTKKPPHSFTGFLILPQNHPPSSPNSHLPIAHHTRITHVSHMHHTLITHSSHTSHMHLTCITSASHTLNAFITHIIHASHKHHTSITQASHTHLTPIKLTHASHPITWPSVIHHTRILYLIT